MSVLDQVLQVVDARSQCPSCRRHDRYPILEREDSPDADLPVAIVGWVCRTCRKQGPPDRSMTTAEMAGVTVTPGAPSEP